MSRHVIFGVLLATGLALGASAAAAQQAAQQPAGAEGQDGPGAAAARPPAHDAPAALPDETPQPPDGAQTDDGAKLTSVPGGKALGMSILGNQEAPTALVIVPWKTSELGGSLGVTPMLDDSRQPVDRDVFMRSLRYYEIRSGKTP